MTGVSRRSPGRGRSSYHHGDLRRALLEGAWQQVRDEGLESLSLRAVARRVGVTHAAPYHHFSSREALLDEMAEQAFAQLETAMRAGSEGVAEPGERFYRLGCAYVDHARAHPEQLRVMFRKRPEEGDLPGPESCRGRSFGLLLAAVDDCQRAGVAPPGEPLVQALAAWSLVHGFASLWVDGPLTQLPPFASRYEALRDSILRGFLSAARAHAAEAR